MSKFIPFFKKFILAALILAIGVAAIPAFSASAAALQDDPIPPANSKDPFPARDRTHLEQVWAHLQDIYQSQENRLAKADEFINWAQSLIDKADQKGWDTSAVQAALDAFASVIPAAQAAHNPGAAIIADHSGFNPNGKVTDRAEAIETVKSLAQVIKNTRAALNGTGQALSEAVKVFRDAHRPLQAPATP